MEDSLRGLVQDFREGLLTRRGLLVKAGALGLSASAAAALAREAEAQTPGPSAVKRTATRDARWQYSCSFCGKSQDNVQRLIAGPDRIYICDECVGLCREILDEDPGVLRAAQVGSPAEAIWGAITSGAWEVVDLSLTTAENHPTNWPTDPLFKVKPFTWFQRISGPHGTILYGQGVAAVQGYEITEHTGTQVDFAPHFIPPPGVDVTGAQGSEMGLKTGDKYPLTSLMGPAVVVDVRALLEANTENGKSAHITRAWLEEWEARFGQFQPGEVPMWFSGYCDTYYQPFPDGDRMKDRMLWAPLVTKSTPGWAAADPDAMDLLHERGVEHVVTDAPSFGWTEDGQPAHVAGLKYGMSYTECAINLGSLPLRGAFFVMAPYKVENQQGGIGRAFAIKAAGAPGVGAAPPLVLG